MASNIYLDLTNRFNEGRLRAILSSGQAVVLHGLAFASKDGDWILREEKESLEKVLKVLEENGARYRLGAPLDVRWMSGGWSAHFEFVNAGERVRCDFVTRPPRLLTEDLALLWTEQETQKNELPVPTIDLRRLAHLKATQRERDWAFIGEIARKLEDVRAQLLWSRSSHDLQRLAHQFPGEIASLAAKRPLLSQVSEDLESLEAALDAERRTLARRDRERLQNYALTAKIWAQNWSDIEKATNRLPLRKAHAILVANAENLLPTEVHNESNV